MQKAKWLSEEALQIAEKRREENSRMGNTSHLFKKLEIPSEYFMKIWAQ